MYKINYLAKRTLNKKLLKDFLDFINEELKINKPYSLYFVEDKTNAKDPLGRTAMYNPSSSSVYIYATNRHPKDILRSIAHELVHHKQHCDGRLEDMSFEKSEKEANAGGFLVRKFEDGRKPVSERKAPAEKEKFSKVSKDYGLADSSGLAKGNGRYKRMTKMGEFRYPTDDAPDWNQNANKWSLKDVLEARKDIWNDNWKLNTSRERTDSITNKQDSEYASVYRNVQDRNIKYLIFNQRAIYDLVKNMNVSKNLPDLPDYSKIKKFDGYNQQLMNELFKNPKNMKMYIGLVKRFSVSGVEGLKISDINKFKKDLDTVLSDLKRQSEQAAKKTYQQALAIIKKGGQDAEAAQNYLIDYATKGQEPDIEGYSGEGPMGTVPWDGTRIKSQDGKNLRIPTYEEFKKGVVDPALSAAQQAARSLKKEQEQNKNSADIDRKERSKFAVYSLPQTNAAYSTYRVYNDGVMRLNVIDPKFGVARAETAAEAGIQLPMPMRQDLLKLAMNKQKGDTSFKKLDTRVRDVYAQSPFGFKSARAINKFGEAFTEELLQFLTIVGAVPLPFTWLADFAAAAILARQKKYGEAVLYTLFPVIFAPIGKDARWIGTTLDGLAGGPVGRKKLYERLFISFLESRTAGVATTEEVLRGAKAVSRGLDDTAAAIRNTTTTTESGVKLTKETENLISYLEEITEQSIKDLEKIGDIQTVFRYITDESLEAARKTQLSKVGEETLKLIDDLPAFNLSFRPDKKFPGVLEPYAEYFREIIKDDLEKTIGFVINDASIFPDESFRKALKDLYKAEPDKAIKQATDRLVFEQLEALARNKSFMSDVKKLMKTQLPNETMASFGKTVSETVIDILKPGTFDKLDNKTKAGLFDLIADLYDGTRKLENGQLTKEMKEALDAFINQTRDSVDEAGKKLVSKDLLSYKNLSKNKNFAASFKSASELSSKSLSKIYAKAQSAAAKAAPQLKIARGQLRTLKALYSQKGTGFVGRFITQYMAGNKILFRTLGGISNVIQKVVMKTGVKSNFAQIFGRLGGGLAYLFIAKLHIPLISYVRFFQPYCGTPLKDYMSTVAALITTKDIFNFIFNPSQGIITYGNIRSEYKKLFGGDDYSPQKSDIFKKYCKDFNDLASYLPEIGEKKVNKVFRDSIIFVETSANKAFNEINEFVEVQVGPAAKELDATAKKAAREFAAAGTKAQKVAKGAGKLAVDVATGKAPKPVKDLAEQAKQTVNGVMGATKKKADAVISEGVNAAHRAANKEFDSLFAPAPEAATPTTKESISLSDYREKLLEERLEKLTIGLIK